MAKSRRQQVWDRAEGCCEYCQLPQTASVLPHEIDHIRSQKHHGTSAVSNLALACFYCNSFKGANVAGYDPTTDQLHPLFDPRQHVWDEHFAWQEAALTGQTPIGRTTIEVLRINLPERIEHRRRLIEAGVFPPS